MFFDIDFWLLPKPYLEIEFDKMGKIDQAIKELGLDVNKKEVLIIGKFTKKKESI